MCFCQKKKWLKFNFELMGNSLYITLLGELWGAYCEYLQVSNISRTLVGNKIVDHSDVVGASPVGAAPTTSSFLT